MLAIVRIGQKATGEKVESRISCQVPTESVESRLSTVIAHPVIQGAWVRVKAAPRISVRGALASR